jgi:iron complex outermembrane receptor protein
MKRYKSIGLAGVATLAMMQAANAAPEAPAAADASSSGLQDIVVTARRTAEGLQSVPVAVTALSGAFLDRQNIVDSTAVQQLAPNISVMQQPNSQSAASVFIRGIGNQEPSSLSEQGVGIYLDGVYLARASGALFDLAELDRIEVLRGPQGTLFGRNTIGGALQLVSKKPANDFHMTAKAGIGRYDDWFVRSRIDTGYIGGSPIKVAIAAQHRQNNGWVNNTLTGSSRDPGAMKANSVVASVEGDFDKLTVNYNFDFDYRNGTPPNFQLVAASPDVMSYYSQSPSFGGAAFLISRRRLGDVQQTGFPYTDGHIRFNSYSRISGHSLTLSYEASPALTLKSITGYRRFLQNTTADLSGNGDLRQVILDPVTFAPSVGSVTPYKGNLNPQQQHQFSQEFQALGTIGDFNYLAGLYYFRESAHESNRQALTFVLSGGTSGLNLIPLQAFSGVGKSKAAFGQVSWKPSALDEKLEITGGVRYTKDKKTAVLAGDVVPNLKGQVSFDNISWLASASYHLDKDIMAYVRASTGYRSGGINPRASVINAFSPEKARAYEVGLKSEFFEHRLRVNLAGFITNYNNLQVSQFAAGSAGATSLIVNAGKVQLKGFEAEVAAAPIEGLSFDGSVGYIDTQYKQFLFRDPATNLLVDVAAAAKPIYTPTWSVHVGGEYSHETGMGIARFRVDYSYRSQVYFNALDNTTPFNEDIKSPSDKNLKARLSLEGVDVGGAKMDFGVWGDNLTNQKNLQYGIDFGALGFAGGVFKKPVTYGIDAKVAF